jgi:hypothetical protein
MGYTVFVSHGWHDRWIARQMARLIRDAGGEPFIDIFDIKKGDRIEAKVQQGLDEATELVALMTPWSVDRNWVWVEISGAWMLRKRYTGILFGLTIDDIEKAHGGLAILGPTNLAALDDFDDYIEELTQRVLAKAKS